MKEKKCLACKKVKKMEEFGINRKAKDGRRKNCNACVQKKRYKGPVDTKTWTVEPDDYEDNLLRNR